MKILPEQSKLNVPSLPEGWFPIGYKIVLGGQLAIVGTDVDLIAAFESDRALKTVRKGWELAKNATTKIWVLYGDQIVESLTFPLIKPFPIVEWFPDGRWLVVNSDSEGEGNVRIFMPDGSQAGCIELGDCINHIKIDAKNRIWVGWFDQGVFGNEKWRVSGHDIPPSAYGIASFDSYGNVTEHATPLL